MRKTPFFSKYRPQFFVRTADIAGTIFLPEKVKMAMPGDNLAITVKLEFPLPISNGQRFAVREGGKTVAAGIVTKITPDSPEEMKEDEERWLKKKHEEKKKV